MRYLNLVLSTTLVLSAASAQGYGQTNGRPPPEGQFEPYHKHRDAHFGHDHFYPDRGSIIREVPKDAVTVSYAGLSYHKAVLIRCAVQTVHLSSGAMPWSENLLEPAAFSQ